MKLKYKVIGLQVIVFVFFLSLIELFCYFQIKHGHLFHFESKVDSSFYPKQNTRFYAKNAGNVKFGTFPVPPNNPVNVENLKPLSFSFTYVPQVTINPSYARVANLPFYIQAMTEDFWVEQPTESGGYRVTYSIDDKFRRKSFNADDSSSRKNFIILAGCSFTFGSGLSDKQTLASQINRIQSDYVAYNYGMPGAAPGDILLRLKSIESNSDIPQKAGTVIYVFIDDHLGRVAHDINIVGTWGAKSSHYEYTHEGDVNFVGMYEDVFPIRTFFYQLIFNTYIAKYFFLGTFNNLNVEHFETLASIVKQMEKVATERLHADNFYVLFYPATYSSRILAPFLEQKNIKYIDYSNWNMFELTLGKSVINYNGHPTVETNSLLAQSLTQVLTEQQYTKPRNNGTFSE